MPAYCVGFVLHDVYSKRIKIKLSGVIALGFFAITAMLFALDNIIVDIFLPTIFAIFTFYIFIALNSILSMGRENIIIKCVRAFGKINFSVYLIHSFVAYEGSLLLLRFISYVAPGGVNESIVFLVYLPFAYLVIFCLAKLFEFYLLGVNKMVTMFSKKTDKEAKF